MCHSAKGTALGTALDTEDAKRQKGGEGKSRSTHKRQDSLPVFLTLSLSCHTQTQADTHAVKRILLRFVPILTTCSILSFSFYSFNKIVILSWTISLLSTTLDHTCILLSLTPFLPLSRRQSFYDRHAALVRIRGSNHDQEADTGRSG